MEYGIISIFTSIDGVCNGIVVDMHVKVFRLGSGS